MRTRQRRRRGRRLRRRVYEVVAETYTNDEGWTDGAGRGTTEGDEHYDRERGVGGTRGAGRRGGRTSSDEEEEDAGGRERMIRKGTTTRERVSMIRVWKETEQMVRRGWRRTTRESGPMREMSKCP